jgi:hypothetical protein
MANIQTHDLQDVISGNTYEGIEFTLPTGEVYDLTNGSAALYVQTGGVTAMQYDSPSELLITLPYKITLPPHIVTLKAHVYDWFLKITFADGRKKTWIKGTWKITE